MAAKPTYPVAFVTSSGRKDNWCGAQESHYQLMRHLPMKALSITSGGQGITRRLSQEGYPVHVIPFAEEKLRGYRSLGGLQKARVLLSCVLYGFRMYRALRRFNVKVVYTVIGAAVLIAPFAAKAAGAKVVTGIRGTPLRMTRWTRVLKSSDRIAALSHESKDILLKRIPDLGSKVEVIYSGVDLDSLHRRNGPRPGEIRRNLGVGTGEILVLYAAAFRTYKGQLRFIQEVLPRFSDARVTNGRANVAFIGGADDPSCVDYERMCREAAAKQPCVCRFAGFQSDVRPWYEAADMVVLASENLEAMPRVIIEAMACGKPVVCYDVCSARELLEGSGGGIVVPQGDAQGMANALVELVKDPDLRKATGERAETFAAAHLDIKAVARDYEKVFRELLGSAPCSS